MMNLFSVFDPISYFGISLNWVIVILLFMFLPMKYFYLSSGNNLFNVVISSGVNEMFREISGDHKMAVSFVCVVTFLYLCLNNLMGLFPYVFTITAHPMITLGWGVIFWLSFFMMGWGKSFFLSAAHLVPEGSPLMLSPIMVIIESVSHLMRPFTLSIRLAANMMAGHLIISLLSSMSMMNLFGFVSSILLQSILLVLEFGVAVIQGFVFSILILLYILEYY